MSFSKFFRQFIRYPATIGAVAPSSEGLANQMIKQIDFDKDLVIVEYGPGTGVFTRKILKNKKDETVFFAFELDEQMYELAKQSVSDAEIIKESAAGIVEHLSKKDLKHADAIVSGLPWAAFSEALQEEILQATIRALKPGGTFSTFAYLQGIVLPSGKRFKRKLREKFSVVKKSPVVWLNMPPALVYWCKK